MALLDETDIEILHSLQKDAKNEEFQYLSHQVVP